MIDRQSLGDIGLAVLLVLPTAALARPSASLFDQRPVAAAPHADTAALADRATIQRRFDLRG
jgi:hypothetical protein